MSNINNENNYLDNNLWSQLLRESSKRPKQPQATCVLVGDIGSGKNSLLDKICNNKSLSNKNGNEIISYNYLDISDEGLEDIENVSRINIWTISDKSFDQSFDVLVNPKITDSLAFIITLDLSREEDCIISLKRWIQEIKVNQTSYLNGISKENNNYNNTENIESIENIIENKNDSTKFIIPVIVVACKSDLLISNDKIAHKKSKEIQGKLRCICLEIGASLIYTSASNNVNCSKLKKYLLYSLYPSIINNIDQVIEESIDQCYIPKGNDSTVLIGNSTGVISYNVDLLESCISYKSRLNIIPKTATPQLIMMESEEDWLLGLQNFISQVTSGGNVITASASNNTTNSNTSTIEQQVPKQVPIARRQTIKPVGKGEKEDVGDFFKSLLTKK